MCRIAFLGFTEKFPADAKPDFIATTLKNMDALGRHSIGISFLLSKPDGSGWDFADAGTVRFLESGEKNYTKVADAVRAAGRFDAVMLHNRYATHGDMTLINAQPIQHGGVMIAHNGIFQKYHRWLADYGVRTDESLEREGKKKTKHPKAEIRLTEKDFLPWSDSHYIAALLNQHGLGALQEKLPGAGALLFRMENEAGATGQVYAIRANGNPIEFFAMSGMFKGADAGLCVYGCISELSHLPKSLEKSETVRDFYLGNVLCFESKKSEALGEFRITVSRSAWTGGIFEIRPGEIRKVGEAFNPEDLDSSYEPKSSKKKVTKSADAASSKTGTIWMKRPTLDFLNAMNISDDYESWYIGHKRVKGISFDSAYGAWIAGENDEFVNFGGIPGAWDYAREFLASDFRKSSEDDPYKGDFAKEQRAAVEADEEDD